MQAICSFEGDEENLSTEIPICCAWANICAANPNRIVNDPRLDKKNLIEFLAKFSQLMLQLNSEPIIN